jgi:hypothetical protein
MLQKKAPFYVDVIEDNDDNLDISDVIIVETEDDTGINDGDDENTVKIFLSSDEDDEEIVSNNETRDEVKPNAYEDPPLEFPSKKIYRTYEEVRDELRRLNRAHTKHVQNSEFHTDKPPMSLPSLEAAVARLSADQLLSKDEEVLRTIGTPVLYWKRKNLDPKDLEEKDFYSAIDMLAWIEDITPTGCKVLNEHIATIRRYDGDVAPVLKEWKRGDQRSNGYLSSPRNYELSKKRQQEQNNSARGVYEREKTKVRQEEQQEQQQREQPPQK